MYNYLCYFLIYSFIGWATEVVYAAIKHNKFINRGFLSGPVCPIYGFGVVIVVLCLNPIKQNIVILYIGSVILTSLLELLTGFIMQKLFKSRWWDYSNNKFNIGGYVCLNFSLLWGIACVVVVDLVHPLFKTLISIIPRFIGIPIAVCFLAIIIADSVYTIIGVNKLNKKLHQMDEFVASMKKISNAIGENVAENAIAFVETTEKLKVESEKTLADIQAKNQIKIKELQLKKEELFKKNFHIHKRLLKAFPDFKSERYSTALEELKEKIRILKR